ncbi:MAG TPA: hypothetical protein VIP98_24115 [Microlunatus sp.]
MDLDQVAAELYAAAPEDFTALRKSRADEARAAGDRALVKQITALRRPTRSAWIVNLLADQAADELTALLDLGAALAQAQQQLSGADLRKLSTQRHAAIAALVRRGSQLAEVRGHTPSEATQREVSATLQASLSDPTIADEVRQGRLSQPREYSGFGPEMVFGQTPVQDQPADTSAEPPNETSDGQHQADAVHDQLVDRLNSAQATLDRTRSTRQHALERADRTAESADRLAVRVTELQDQLKRVKRDARQATEKLAQERANLDELQQAEQAAEAAVAEALARLAGD